MKLAYWMYNGPAHIGTLRIASSFKNVHAIMHAPLGDDYFNVMRSMLERRRDFTPVTTSIVDRHVLTRGSQDKVIDNIIRKDKEENPDLIILTPTCTSSILQEDLQNFVKRASIDTKHADVLLADVNHYRVNEFQAADRTLNQIVQFYLKKSNIQQDQVKKTTKPSVNIIGAVDLAFHNQHDILELKRLINDLGLEINLVIPQNCSVEELKKLPSAWINIVPYREIGLSIAESLKDTFDMPFISTTPMGICGIATFIKEIQELLKNQGYNVDYSDYIDQQTRFISQSAWFSKSIDCQNLTGKRVVVFGDATHSAAMTKILSQEMGIKVVWAGTYCLNEKEWFTDQVQDYCDEVLITQDHNLVGDLIAQAEPAAIFGTQMERHCGKRLNIPCGVISTPVHIQNFPLSYRPFLGYEGANQIADLIYNSFTLGMEDHLLEIFGGHDTREILSNSISANTETIWSKEASKELEKIPGFVRGKILRNTEKFAKENNISVITLEVLYSAKEALNT
uniref:Light-independent protochlorophyllide reductase subunit B n=2 Tax=Aureoumbra lagunensis TaxID=44058 RepID=C6KIZ7_9STRA|nr:photochlorophyllide reductase subunit B [Aureoumbra lagunensis]ACS36953.1 photochlorophyllide reductase subunit B [Aureoumbra lagunensis]